VEKIGIKEKSGREWRVHPRIDHIGGHRLLETKDRGRIRKSLLGRTQKDEEGIRDQAEVVSLRAKATPGLPKKAKRDSHSVLETKEGLHHLRHGRGISQGKRA